MNTITHIHLVQFRNYGAAGFGFEAPVTCITGPNGSGKTTLLDAIYYLCYTKSYLSAYQQHSVQTGMDGFRLEGKFRVGEREEAIVCKWKQGKKEVSANGTPYERLNDHIGKYAAVMVAPDDMELINDGSELRRRWIDSILGQTERPYLEALMRYQRVLLQRNAWLKLHSVNPPPASDELAYYDNALAADGQLLHGQRAAFIAGFIPLLEEYYHKLSGGSETVAAVYESDLHQKPLAQWLAEGLQHDLRLQRTLRGVHKDDISFLLQERGLKQYASQGQKKSFLFALKLAQYTYLHRTQGHPPILLLDDIFEKLDQQRMEALLRIIRGEGFGQVILTDTHAERVQAAFGEDVGIGFVELGYNMSV